MPTHGEPSSKAVDLDFAHLRYWVNHFGGLDWERARLHALIDLAEEQTKQLDLVRAVAGKWADRKRSDAMSGNAWIGLTLSRVAEDLFDIVNPTAIRPRTLGGCMWCDEDECDHGSQLAEGDESQPPPCDNHKEVQHRDRRVPWCEACGWNHGRPATPAVEVKKTRTPVQGQHHTHIGDDTLFVYDRELERCVPVVVADGDGSDG